MKAVLFVFLFIIAIFLYACCQVSSESSNIEEKNLESK